jgi:hypothetical protein
MRKAFRMGRIIFCLLLVYGTITGYDEVVVGLNSELKEITIEEAEKNGAGTSRYVLITGGVSAGKAVYHFKENTDEITKIIFPLYALQRALRDSSELKTAYVVVLDDDVDIRIDELDAYMKSKLEFDTKGIVRVGMGSLETEDRALLSKSGIIIPQNAIFVDQGTEPKGVVFGFVLMLFCGGILIFQAWSLVRWIMSPDGLDENERAKKGIE